MHLPSRVGRKNPTNQTNVNKYSTQLRFARAHDPVYLLGISVIALCASVLL